MSRMERSEIRERSIGLSRLHCDLLWLACPIRPLFAIARSSERAAFMDKSAPPPALDEQGIKNLMEHAAHLWWTPEMERRRAASILPADFRMVAGQVLFPENGRAIVRFNDEVRGVAEMRTRRPVQKGDPVYSNDLEGLVRFDLLAEELEHGHFTMILTGDHWFISFNFLRRRAYCAKLITQAKQFLASAKFGLEQKANAPCVDNLFSACELAAKVHTILHMLPGAKSKKHGAIHSSINAWGRSGNIGEDFVTLFNRLTDLRPRARYQAGEDRMEVSSADIEIVEAELLRTSQRCEQKVEENPADGKG